MTRPNNGTTENLRAIMIVRQLTLVSALFISLLVGCAAPQPSLERLYRTSNTAPDQPPVILIHGAFGSRLCDEASVEHWPAGLSGILFSDYNALMLPLVEGENTEQANLHPCGLTDRVVGQDFYGAIEDTLIGPGGYSRATTGQAVSPGNRHYYRFTYDWRQDNARSAEQLDRFVEQIRTDHGKADLKVDIVAHSMGGLLTRYWLRYGRVDVLDDNEFPVNNVGGNKVRRVVLVGTPNLGSTSALQQILKGADFGFNTVRPEILLSFPSAYQLLPHPIVDAVINKAGEPLERDIFDIMLWRTLEWGPFDPDVHARLKKANWMNGDIKAWVSHLHKYLERARRFVWSLTVENPNRPYELTVFGGDCVPSPARVLIENSGDDSYVRLWPHEVKNPLPELNYAELMLEPGDGAVTKASLLARTELDPSIPRHQFSDFPENYSVMYCEEHTQLPGNITFRDNLLHILLSR